VRSVELGISTLLAPGCGSVELAGDERLGRWVRALGLSQPAGIAASQREIGLELGTAASGVTACDQKPPAERSGASFMFHVKRCCPVPRPCGSCCHYCRARAAADTIVKMYEAAIVQMYAACLTWHEISAVKANPWRLSATGSASRCSSPLEPCIADAVNQCPIGAGTAWEADSAPRA
jgi:hypothetical protein